MKKLLFTLLVFCSCSSGGDGGRDSGTGLGGSNQANFNCDGSCINQNLSIADVTQILKQAEAAKNILNGILATVAVVDRVGNVLAVYQMSGAVTTVKIEGRIGANGGLEGIEVPATLAAISKAGTAAYLSSQGNSFSTRTASQIIQENFNPGENNVPGGPLFGVQFSQLICSDVTEKSSGLTGPRPLPLGLSADPGGFPLYKEGDLVGGIGVEVDGSYTFDQNIVDYEANIEEEIALLSSSGFLAPSERVANNIIVGGKSLRFSDLGVEELSALPAELPELNSSSLIAVNFFFAGTIKEGVAFGTPASGFANTLRAGIPATDLVDAAANLRFPTKTGVTLSGQELQAAEVDAILDSALLTANRARAAIRRPLDTAARVSIFVIDTKGSSLGFVRSQDAPVFGTDVALQKARTALFFSSADAASQMSSLRETNNVGDFSDYLSTSQNFVGDFIFTGTHAFSNRAVGNLARPFYPDGINGNPSGPLSLPFPGTSAAVKTWSPFNTGFQLDLIFQRLLQPLSGTIPNSCTHSSIGDRLRNGIQIFAGSVPLYRGNTLIGAIGVSGDGIDQDDMVAFFGASRKGLDFAGHPGVGDPELGFNAPKEIRADLIQPQAVPSTRLRYVNCPEGAFINNNEQNVCDGL